MFVLHRVFQIGIMVHYIYVKRYSITVGIVSFGTPDTFFINVHKEAKKH